MSKFTVGVSAALFGAAGKPCFNDERILAEVRDHDEIELVIMPEGKTHLNADDAARFDAVYLMLERADASTIDRPGRIKADCASWCGFDTIGYSRHDRSGCNGHEHTCRSAPPGGHNGLTLMLAVSHRLIEKHYLTRAGRWAENADFMGTGLTGRKLGVLGAGSIGSEILRLVVPFDMQLMACDPYVDTAHLAALNTKKVEVKELFSS